MGGDIKRDALCLANTYLPSACSPPGKVGTGNTYSLHQTDPSVRSKLVRDGTPDYIGRHIPP